MKYLAAFLLISCLLGVALAALKNPECGEEFGKIGICRALKEKWSYRQDTNECLNFKWGGCEGNKNLFDTQKICEETCKV